MILSWAFLTLALAASHPGQLPPCELNPVAETVGFENAPVALRRAIAGQFSPFAMPGQPFDHSDEIKLGIRRRLMWVKHSAQRWVVTFEEGGRGVNVYFVAYDVGAEGEVSDGQRCSP